MDKRGKERWWSKNFDPHFILGLPHDPSRKSIVEAHRRHIISYHPDKHNNAPLANELTKHLNAARDKLLGEGPRGSQSQRQQSPKQQEAQQRARDAQRAQQEERIKRTYERIRREAEEIWQNETQPHSRHSTQTAQSNQPQRKHSPVWTGLGITLFSIIAAYLALTVIAPAYIDSLMQEWARLFN